MKITRPFFTYSKDFNILEMCNMFLTNHVPLSDDGTIVSFVCPIELNLNGQDVQIENALNFCYVFPESTAKEHVYFQYLFNSMIADEINSVFPDANVKSESSIIEKDSGIAGVSMMKRKGGCGIGWHSLFVTKTPKDGVIKFSAITEDSEENMKKIEEARTNLDMRFLLLRRTATTAIISTLS